MIKISWNIVKTILFFVFILLPFNLFAKDRCQDYIPDVRQYAIQYLGMGYPYFYNIGCMIAESSCRPNIVSFDGGIGLFQLTPSTGVTKEISKYIKVDPYNIHSNIRAQAFYISLIMKKFKTQKATVGKSKYPIYPAKFTGYCGLNLQDIYRFYNGGYWFFYEASRKKGVPYVCENREMFKYCVRGGTYTDKAKTKWLSFCEINYSYPEKIYKYSQKYNTGLHYLYNFWYEKQNKPKLFFWYNYAK